MALGAVFSWIIYNMVCSNFKGHYKSITITTYRNYVGITIFKSFNIF